ncbi:MAG: long-chain-fatty-acid--CoA ligase [Steroidobacteraceae bacterium]
MKGLMMDTPLLITDIMRHAERCHGSTEVVSVTVDNPRHRTTLAEIFRRARKLANALKAAGIRKGDRVGTVAWNDYRHLELYYAVSCMGAVLHTINPRLFPEQVGYIVNHAEDRLLFVDPLVMPLIDQLRPGFGKVEQVIALCDAAHLPQASNGPITDYESFIAPGAEEFHWPEFDEHTASSLCYTSGTTGHPKGVLFSHRSTVLHNYAALIGDSIGCTRRDTILVVVPMFHVNAWGIPYAGPSVGTRLVMPGPKMGDGATLAALITEEGCTLAAGVPTVWQALLAHARTAQMKLSPLRRVSVGGSACPLSIMTEFRERHDVEVLHAWGMTEMSPIGTLNSPPRGFEDWPPEEQDALRIRQGQPVLGVQMKIVDDQGHELPHDGRTSGIVKVRGPWICSSYYQPDEPSDAHAEKGWFATGDVATLHPDGTMTITDRAKDVIKSGGEWISSIDLENTVCGHPQVMQAAVIGVRHPKWDERPLLIVVPQPGESPTREALLQWLADKVAKWWIPDDVVFVDKLPLTATGKISKLQLRQQFADHALPTA